MEELMELFAVNQTLNMAVGVVNLVVAIFSFVAMWIIYNKAGEGGWKLLIPIYGGYIRYKIAGCKGRYWASFLLSLLSTVLMSYGVIRLAEASFYTGVPDSVYICILASVALVLVVAVIGITVNFKLARAFGRSWFFGLGLWLLPVIFYLILAFDSSIVYYPEHYSYYRG